MNRRRLVVFPALMVLLGVLVAPVSGLMYTPLLQVSSGDTYLTAGVENEIRLELENMGDFDVFEVQGVLISQTPGISVVSGNQRVWNEIEEDEEVSWSPAIYVNSEVQLGTYSLNLVVSYIKMYQTGSTKPGQADLQIGVIVDRRAAQKLKYIPPMEDIYLNAGSTSNVSFSLQNIWDKDIRELDISIESPSPHISILEGLNYDSAGLESGESINLKPVLFTGENTKPGEYFLKATAYFKDRDGNRYHRTFNVPMMLDSVGTPRVTKVNIKSAATNPETVNPGHKFDLDIVLEVSGAKAFEVTTTLNIPRTTPLSPLSPTITRLGDFQPGDTAEAQYKILADGTIQAGPYPIAVTTSYIDSKGQPQTSTETLTVLVEGILDFTLLKNDVPELERGSEKEIEADLLLIGTERARFVELALIEDEVFHSVPGSTEYIGAIDPDSPLPFEITVGVDQDATVDNHVIRMRVKYLDHLNREKQDEIDVPVTVIKRTQEVEASSGGGLWLWLRRLFGLTP